MANFKHHISEQRLPGSFTDPQLVWGGTRDDMSSTCAEYPNSNYEPTRSEVSVPALTESRSTLPDLATRTTKSSFDQCYTLSGSAIPRSVPKFACFFSEFRECEIQFENVETEWDHWCLHAVEHLREDQQKSRIESMTCCGQNLDSTWKGLFEHLVLHYTFRAMPFVDQTIVKYLRKQELIPHNIISLPPGIHQDQNPQLTAHTTIRNRRRDGSSYHADNRQNRNDIAHAFVNNPTGGELNHIGLHAFTGSLDLSTVAQLGPFELDDEEENAGPTSRRRSMD
ncbi:hypothetical protein BZA77DRAFT_144076 [Pyronema omphalodes]|nr:hypothetical protein BZA77DRAFT_144076 [Pyronema omphalodes]